MATLASRRGRTRPDWRRRDPGPCSVARARPLRPERLDGDRDDRRRVHFAAVDALLDARDIGLVDGQSPKHFATPSRSPFVLTRRSCPSPGPPRRRRPSRRADRPCCAHRDPPPPLTDEVAMCPAPVRPGAHAVRVRSGAATKRRQYPPSSRRVRALGRARLRSCGAQRRSDADATGGQSPPAPPGVVHAAVNTTFGPGSVMASTASEKGTTRWVTRSACSEPCCRHDRTSGRTAREWTRPVWNVRPL